MSEQSERKDKRMVIASKCNFTQDGNAWHIPSQSRFKPFYAVNPVAKTCGYPDYEKREASCRIICEQVIGNWQDAYSFVSALFANTSRRRRNKPNNCE